MKARPFQKQCVREIESDEFDGRVLVALDMGLGKTPIALWSLKRNPTWLPAVVVCPASVKYHWEHLVLELLGFRPEVLEGQKPPKGRRFKLHEKVAIINYDILQYWLRYLQGYGAQTVVIDECQKIANQTKRTKAVRSLCSSVPHILALSGTPLVNRPIELYNTLNLIDPKGFSSRFTYGQQYCGAKWTPWGWKFNGASKTKKLRRVLLQRCMVRRRKQDVLPELPDKIRQVIPLPIKHPDEYRKASNNFLTWLREHDLAAAHRAAKAEMITKTGYLLRLAARLKHRYVVDWIEEFMEGSDEKLVVFVVHKKMSDILRRKVSVKSLLIDGSITGRKRKAVVEQFRNDRMVRLLVGNLEAMGTGVDGLQGACSHAAFAELGWRPGDHTQGEDRLHRIGQHGTVFTYYLVAHGTIEEKMCEIIQEKQQVLSAILDGGKIEGDLDVFDRLILELKKGR